MQRNFLPSASGKAFDFQDKSKTKRQGCFCIAYSSAPPSPGSLSGHRERIRAAPQPSAGMTGTSPGSFQWQGIAGLSAPQPWHCSLAQGDDANLAPQALCPPLPGGPWMGCWSCPWHGALLSRGFVQHCSNLDQEWPAESFRGAALLRGGCGSEQSSWHWEEKPQPRD